MASHRAANFANVALQTLGGAGIGFATGGIPGAVAGGAVGATNSTRENVQGHRARKKEEMAKKKVVPGGKPAKNGNPNEWWNGKGEKIQQVPLLSPEQMEANSIIRQKSLKQLQGDQFDLEPQENRARAHFKKNVRPGLAEMFNAHGGQTSTSAYQNALGLAEREHEEGLDILRREHNFKQQDFAQNLFKQVQQPEHHNFYTPPTGGLKGGLIESVPGLLNTAAQYGVPALVNWATGGDKTQTPSATAQATPTIGEASTPAGQAAQNLTAATAGANVTGGAKTVAQGAGEVARQGGITTAGKAVGGVAAGLALHAATNWLVNQMRKGANG